MRRSLWLLRGTGRRLHEVIEEQQSDTGEHQKPEHCSEHIHDKADMAWDNRAGIQIRVKVEIVTRIFSVLETWLARAAFVGFPTRKTALPASSAYGVCTSVCALLWLSWSGRASRRTTFELAFALGDRHERWDAENAGKVLLATELRYEVGLFSEVGQCV